MFRSSSSAKESREERDTPRVPIWSGLASRLVQGTCSDTLQARRPARRGEDVATPTGFLGFFELVQLINKAMPALHQRRACPMRFGEYNAFGLEQVQQSPKPSASISGAMPTTTHMRARHDWSDSCQILPSISLFSRGPELHATK